MSCSRDHRRAAVLGRPTDAACGGAALSSTARATLVTPRRPPRPHRRRAGARRKRRRGTRRGGLGPASLPRGGARPARVRAGRARVLPARAQSGGTTLCALARENGVRVRRSTAGRARTRLGAAGGARGRPRPPPLPPLGRRGRQRAHKRTSALVRFWEWSAARQTRTSARRRSDCCERGRVLARPPPPLPPAGSPTAAPALVFVAAVRHPLDRALSLWRALPPSSARTTRARSGNGARAARRRASPRADWLLRRRVLAHGEAGGATRRRRACRAGRPTHARSRAGARAVAAAAPAATAAAVRADFAAAGGSTSLLGRAPRRQPRHDASATARARAARLGALHRGRRRRARRARFTGSATRRARSTSCSSSRTRPPRPPATAARDVGPAARDAPARGARARAQLARAGSSTSPCTSARVFTPSSPPPPGRAAGRRRRRVSAALAPRFGRRRRRRGAPRRGTCRCAVAATAWRAAIAQLGSVRGDTTNGAGGAGRRGGQTSSRGGGGGAAAAAAAGALGRGAANARGSCSARARTATAAEARRLSPRHRCARAGRATACGGSARSRSSCQELFLRSDRDVLLQRARCEHRLGHVLARQAVSIGRAFFVAASGASCGRSATVREQRGSPARAGTAAKPAAVRTRALERRRRTCPGQPDARRIAGVLNKLERPFISTGRVGRPGLKWLLDWLTVRSVDARIRRS